MQAILGGAREGFKNECTSGTDAFESLSILAGLSALRDVSFRKACPRTLDRPIVLFGLEPEELVVVGLVSGAILFLIDAIPAVLAGAVMWTGLSRLKAGRPPGYLFELAYRAGLLKWAPGLFGAPHLLPPKTRHLDAFPGGDDEAVRRYWSDRPRLGA